MRRVDRSSPNGTQCFWRNWQQHQMSGLRLGKQASTPPRHMKHAGPMLNLTANGRMHFAKDMITLKWNCCTGSAAENLNPPRM